jgi:TusA-related sulfurtransferase
VSNSDQYHQAVNASGLECPLPLLETKLALKTLAAGEVLWVTATDAGSWRDIRKYIAMTNNELVAASDVDGCYQFWIKKGA